jgi:hypothetical protein
MPVSSQPCLDASPYVSPFLPFSSLQLLVCTVNFLVSSLPLTPQEVRQLQSEYPAAIDANSKFNTLKALSHAAKIDYPSTKASISS